VAEKLLTLKEAAPHLGFRSIEAMRKWLQGKPINVVQRGPRSRFIRQSDIDDYLKKHTIPAAQIDAAVKTE
jgi:hypothetical protein